MENEHVTIYIIYNFHAMIKSEKKTTKKKQKKNYILSHTEQGINANMIYCKN